MLEDMEDKQTLILAISRLPSDVRVEVLELLPDSHGVRSSDLDLDADRLIVSNLSDEHFTAIRNSDLSLWIEAIYIVSAIASGVSMAGIPPLVALLYKFRTRSAIITAEQRLVLAALAKDSGSYLTLPMILESISRTEPDNSFSKNQLQSILESLGKVTLRDGSDERFVSQMDGEPPRWKILNV